MAAEFEYSKDDLNRGVQHFMTEMREGLGKTGGHISQIPTYVTAVPNGTEKVRAQISLRKRLTIVGNILSSRSWWHKLSRLLDYLTRQSHLLLDSVKGSSSSNIDGNAGCC